MWRHLSCTVYLLKSAETHGCRDSSCICLFIDVLMELHRFRINAVSADAAGPSAGLLVVLGGWGGTNGKHLKGTVHPQDVTIKWTFPTESIFEEAPTYILKIYYTVHVWVKTNSHFFFWKEI